MGYIHRHINTSVCRFQCYGFRVSTPVRYTGYAIVTGSFLCGLC